MPTDECPPRDELVAFHRGLLRPADVDRVADHLEGCPACEALLEEMDAGAGTLHAALREGPTIAFPHMAEEHIHDAPPEGLVAGRYRILGPIGDGGMGAVFRAEQVEPVRRTVALKLIRAGMDSRPILSRFEAERQALAMMDHPNIARILDAGTTEQGRPFFVMELVEGPPITAYCDDRHLTTERRLELFIAVCQAVQHAHQKGVIHRDLKPSNILVAETDGRPVPKVIDFGIAKATGPALSLSTTITSVGMIVGTPAYMAPEQASLDSSDIDTRADIYALGVLLYELLTGSTPLTRRRLGEAAILEILRLVREEEPPTPSSRLIETDDLPTVAANRGVEPRRLSWLVRGDLDWVVMKALEKDRDRRYESADSLARDVRRHLDDAPVEAGRPSVAYRFRKFARRHRGPFRAAGLAATLLIAATAFSAWQAARLARERDDKQEALEQATAARQRADDELANREAVLTFFVDKILAAGRPVGVGQGQGPGVTLLAAVDAAAGDVGEEFRDRPAVEAAVREAIGETYNFLGRHQPAIEQLARALHLFEALDGPGSEKALDCANALSEARLKTGDAPGARALMERVVAGRKALHGPDHLNTLAATGNLATNLLELGEVDKAIALYEGLLDARLGRSGPDDHDTLVVRSNLGLALKLAGRTDEAIRHHEETIRRLDATVGPDRLETLRVRLLLGDDHLAKGDFAGAIAILEPTIARIRGHLDDKSPMIAISVSNLADAYLNLGRTVDAIRSLRLLVELEEALPGMNPAILANHREVLAEMLMNDDQPGEAVPLLEAALADRRAGGDADGREALNVRKALADALARADRPAESLGYRREVVRILGKDRASSAEWADASIRLAEDCLERGDEAGALAAIGAFLDRRREHFGAESRRHAVDLVRAAWALSRHDAFAAAEPQARRGLAILERDAPDDWLVPAARSILGGILLGRGRPDDAAPLLISGYEGLKARADQIPPEDQGHLPEAADRLVRLSQAGGPPGDRERWERERAAQPARFRPPSGW